MKRSKAYRAAENLVEEGRLYSPAEAAALEEILRLKPSAAKGRYLRKAVITTTMGPGIPVDPAKTRGLTEELEPAAS